MYRGMKLREPLREMPKRSEWADMLPVKKPKPEDYLMDDDLPADEDLAAPHPGGIHAAPRPPPGHGSLRLAEAEQDLPKLNPKPPETPYK
jgi:hypothetical protein